MKRSPKSRAAATPATGDVAIHSSDAGLTNAPWGELKGRTLRSVYDEYGVL